MWQWYIVTISLMVTIHFVAPQQLTVVVYKVALVTLAAVLTYMIDGSLFKRASDRVNCRQRDVFSAARMLSRALVFLGVVLGVSLGL